MEISEQVYWGVRFLTAISGRERTKAGLDCNAVSTKTSANPIGSFEAVTAIQNFPQLGGEGELFYTCVNHFIDEGYPGKGT